MGLSVSLLFPGLLPGEYCSQLLSPPAHFCLPLLTVSFQAPFVLLPPLLCLALTKPACGCGLVPRGQQALPPPNLSPTLGCTHPGVPVGLSGSQEVPKVGGLGGGWGPSNPPSPGERKSRLWSSGFPRESQLCLMGLLSAPPFLKNKIGFCCSQRNKDTRLCLSPCPFSSLRPGRSVFYPPPSFSASWIKATSVYLHIQIQTASSNWIPSGARVGQRQACTLPSWQPWGLNPQGRGWGLLGSELLCNRSGQCKKETVHSFRMSPGILPLP